MNQANQNEIPRGIRGKSFPMQTISAVPAWRAWLTRLVYLLLRNLASFTELKALRFIHFARWVVLKPSAFPRFGNEQPRQPLRDNFILFSTNFNGKWDQYIDAFVFLLGLGVDAIWFTGRRYPGVWPIRTFKRTIRYYQYPTDYYFNAYPGASVTDVLTAIELVHALKEFEKKAERIDEASRFKEEYDALVRTVANYLPTAEFNFPHEREPWENIQPIDLKEL